MKAKSMAGMTLMMAVMASISMTDKDPRFIEVEPEEDKKKRLEEAKIKKNKASGLIEHVLGTIVTRVN